MRLNFSLRFVESGHPQQTLPVFFRKSNGSELLGMRGRVAERMHICNSIERHPFHPLLVFETGGNDIATSLPLSLAFFTCLCFPLCPCLVDCDVYARAELVAQTRLVITVRVQLWDVAGSDVLHEM